MNMLDRMLERLAFLTNAYTNGDWSLESAIERIAKEGYAGVGILADAPLIWLPDLSANERSEKIRSLREVLASSGIAVSSVNGFTAAGYYGARDTAPGQQFGPSFSDADQELREYKVNYTRLVVDLAADLNCPNVSFGSGYPPEGVEREEAWQWMSEAIAKAVDYAQSKGVRLNLEYEPDLLIGGADDAARLLEEMPSASLGLNFDIGHSFVCGEDVVKEIHRFGDQIHGVDFEDIGVDETGKPVHAHQVPGQGVMPLEDILRAFEEIGYDGWFTVELYNHSHHPEYVTRASMEASRQIFQRLKEGELYAS